MPLGTGDSHGTAASRARLSLGSSCSLNLNAPHFRKPSRVLRLPPPGEVQGGGGGLSSPLRGDVTAVAWGLGRPRSVVFLGNGFLEVAGEGMIHRAGLLLPGLERAAARWRPGGGQVEASAGVDGSSLLRAEGGLEKEGGWGRLRDGKGG